MDQQHMYPAPAYPAPPADAPPAVAPAATGEKAGLRRPRRRIPKPQLDRVLDDKGLLVGILLLPLLAAVAFVAQFLELLYYLCLLVYGIVMSPFWSVRALWRAFGPAGTPEELDRRAEARKTVKTTAGCLAWIVGLVLVVLGAMVAIGLNMDR
ncbi:hypothetical protein [Streptomyces hiroshimensis]|uniref:Transmembrane protein n=1 Tax=Streptomyces hiroshimensis TaxID=66424 RepID=A0ABQ2YAV5_9ACTN|nr:hypothetical protein [Streptomyces hiroshimensis]GGX74760.1 hypothetical protein GCM10010324_20150 [Streptomyces hiroshimensis]